MPRKRRRRRTRPSPHHTEHVPPERVNHQAGVSLSENRGRVQPRKKKKRRAVPSTVKLQRSDGHRQVAEHTYHSRRRKSRDVKPFSMKQARRQAKREQRLRYRRSENGKALEIIYKVLITAAVLAIVFFTFGVFFGVEKVTAVNSKYYFDSEIIRASGIEYGDKILFINRGKVYDNIINELPYIRSARIKIKFPTTVEIEVTEREPVAKIENGGFEYILSDDGILLESTVIRGKYEVPTILCAAPTETEPGKKLTFENEVIGATLDEVLHELVSLPTIAKIDRINIEKVYDITFLYDERLEIHIGDTVDMEKKAQMLTEVLKRIGTSATGIVNVKNPDMVRFREQALS